MSEISPPPTDTEKPTLRTMESQDLSQVSTQDSTLVHPPTWRQWPWWWWTSIAVSYLGLIVIGTNDGTPGVLLPPMKEFYGVDDVRIALVFIFNLIGYLISSFLTGWIVEKVGIRIFLGGVNVLYVIATLVNGFGPPFPALLAMMILIGAAVAGIDAGYNAYIVRFPNNTVLLNYLHAFYGVGAWIGPLIATACTVQAGWPWYRVYFVLCGVSALPLIGVLTVFRSLPADFAVKGDQKDASAGLETEQEKEGNVIVLALRVGIVWLCGLMFFVYVGTEVAMGNWSYSLLLSRQHSEYISGWLVSIYWLGLTMGRVVLGHAAERVGKMRLIYGSLTLTLAGLFIVWFGRVEPALGIGLFIVGFGLGPVFPTAISCLTDYLPTRIQTTAIGFVAAFSCVGSAVLNWFGGFLAQTLGRESLLPYEVILVVIMLGVWGVVHWRGNLLLKRKKEEEEAASRQGERTAENAGEQC
ncbi:uncharacterized protein VTP21DRAFT_7694 [Calcarisporiella thermophila]|uniref:uncharacterized protein n=1 Tax=Calcarisporiella thermophila TaxID=911321 RepID=UPI003744A1CC